MDSSGSHINGDSTNAHNTEDGLKYGFRRPEMYQNPLTSTVEAYDRHVFLCVKDSQHWPSSVENPDFDPLPRLLASTLKAKKNQIHGKNRDRRCDLCGPVLVKRFKEEIEMRGMKIKVFVSPCSHLGGHQYAVNLIIFGPGIRGNCEGHWYGYVTPNEVPALLDDHIRNRQIVARPWRGQMGLSNGIGNKVSRTSNWK